MDSWRCSGRTATLLGLLLTFLPAFQAEDSPIFFIPGFMVSNLTGSISVAGACTQARSDVQFWPPQVSDLLAGRDCWYQSIQLDYVAGRFKNGTGAAVSAAPFDSTPSVNTSLGIMVAAIEKMFPTYKYGVNLFIMAYDWRLDVNSLAQTLQLQQLAQAIFDKTSSSNRAILMGHSLGALVATRLLQNADVRARVKGFVSYSAPFGGAMTAIQPRISGELSSLAPPELLAGVAPQIPGIDAFIREVTWNGVHGMASLALLLPYSAAYANGTDPVVVRTAGRSYRVSQMATLLKDIGDWQLAKSYAQTHTADTLVAAGPIPGVDVYCIYGFDINTIQQLVFNVTLSTSINPLPSSYVYGRGDSFVSFNSLKLCDRLTTGTGRVRRIPGSSGTHLGIYADSTVLRHTRMAIAALRRRT